MCHARIKVSDMGWLPRLLFEIHVCIFTIFVDQVRLVQDPSTSLHQFFPWQRARLNSQQGFLFSRTFSLLIKSFISDGQAIAIKLANQIDKVVNSMNQGLATLNGLMGDEVVTFEDIKDPGGDLYCELHFLNDTALPKLFIFFSYFLLRIVL